jgi:hypothetical protein
MANIDDRLHDQVNRRRQLPGSIAVMETGAEAEKLNMNICALESYTMRLAACWDGEMGPIGAYSQLAYLYEKADGAEKAAAEIRQAIERLTAWDTELDEP